MAAFQAWHALRVTTAAEQGDATLLSSLLTASLREAMWDAAERLEPHPGALSECL